MRAMELEENTERLDKALGVPAPAPRGVADDLEGLEAKRAEPLFLLPVTVARGDHRPSALPRVRRGPLPAGPAP